MSLSNYRKQILCSTYESVVSDAGGAWVDAVALPFPLEGADSAELMTNYGTELDSGDKSWSGKQHQHQISLYLCIYNSAPQTNEQNQTVADDRQCLLAQFHSKTTTL